MIKAVYTADGDIHTLAVKGHAGYAEYGKDIVCAGVSALVQALIGWAENNPDTVECIDVDNGDVTIVCNGGKDVSAVFHMTAVGIEMIGHTYPDNVEINIIVKDDWH